MEDGDVKPVRPASAHYTVPKSIDVLFQAVDDIARTRIGEDLHLGVAPRTSNVSIAPLIEAEDRPNGRPDVGFEPCSSTSAVRSFARPATCSERSLQVAARCLLVLETVAVNLSYHTFNQGHYHQPSKQKIAVYV
jgi:hypothetical protein